MDVAATKKSKVHQRSRKYGLTPRAVILSPASSAKIVAKTMLAQKRSRVSAKGMSMYTNARQATLRRMMAMMSFSNASYMTTCT